MRELENLVQGLVVTCKRGVIDAADLAGISHESCQASAGENCWYPKIEGRSLKSIMRDVENAVIEQGLKRYGSLVSFSAICIWTAARRSEKSKAGNLPNRMNVCLQKLSVAGPHKKVQFMPSRSCKQIFARAQRRAAAPALRQGLQQDDEEPPATKDVCLILPYGRRERQKELPGRFRPGVWFLAIEFCAAPVLQLRGNLAAHQQAHLAAYQHAAAGFVLADADF